MRRFLAMVFLAMLTANAAAAESTPLLYTRTNLRIVRIAPPADAFMPWEDTSHGDKGVVIDAEMRDGAVMYKQKGWYNLSSPSETGGVLLVFSAPVVTPISPSAQYAPLDILMIDKEGRIAQIAPDIQLSNLREDIYPEAPILALLFLKGGLCERFSIRPGDWVEHPLFKKPPKVLTAPPPAASLPPLSPSPPAALVPSDVTK